MSRIPGGNVRFSAKAAFGSLIAMVPICTVAPTDDITAYVTELMFEPTGNVNAARMVTVCGSPAVSPQAAGTRASPTPSAVKHLSDRMLVARFISQNRTVAGVPRRSV